MGYWIQEYFLFFDPAILSWENVQNMPKKEQFLKSNDFTGFWTFSQPRMVGSKKKSIPVFSIPCHKFRVPTWHISDLLFLALYGGYGHLKYPCGQVKTKKIEKIKNMLILVEVIGTRKQHGKIVFWKKTIYVRQANRHAAHIFMRKNNYTFSSVICC